MSTYENMFEILDLIEEAEQELREYYYFRRELFLLSPNSDELSAIINNTIKTVIRFIEVKEEQISELKDIYNKYLKYERTGSRQED